VTDINGGSPLGLAEIIESHTKGQRVIASTAYLLNGVTGMSSTLARKIIISQDGKNVEKGVELADGRKLAAEREVILSAGSLRTPQILMLSGIGPAEELQRHSIKQVVDSPEVGKTLWDHLALAQLWKLRHPEIGAAVGSPQFTDPAFMNGNPMDWLTTTSVPHEGLKAALFRDLDGPVQNDHPLLVSPK
jgi:choline dehydrogenase-like flavoprotein